MTYEYNNATRLWADIASNHAMNIAIDDASAQRNVTPPVEPQIDLARLAAITQSIDPVDLGSTGVQVVLTALVNETHGQPCGLAIAIDWLRDYGEIYSGDHIAELWSAIQADPDPYLDSTFDTLQRIARQYPVSKLASDSSLSNHEEPISDLPAPRSSAEKIELDKYVLNGKLADIEESAIVQTPIYGNLALMGQATIFYAAPNTGKTLLSLAFTIEGIKAGLIDPARLYYINNDDSTTGLAEKLRIAEEYGFKMLAEAYEGFDANMLLSILTNMIDNNQASGVVVVLDTATKVVNVLDAAKTRMFTKVIRKFVLKGGTLIALGHANKSPGADGKPVYRGTTDILNDFDCAYVVYELRSDCHEKIVVFENKKMRGNVARTVAYRYTTESGISYNELLASVSFVDQDKVDAVQREEETSSDAEVIGVAEACITSGTNTKMLLADAIAKRAGISKRRAIKVIERYTGTDPSLHRWQFAVKERGAKVFEILDRSPPTISGGIDD